MENIVIKNVHHLRMDQTVGSLVNVTKRNQLDVIGR